MDSRWVTTSSQNGPKSELKPFPKPIWGTRAQTNPNRASKEQKRVSFANRLDEPIDRLKKKLDEPVEEKFEILIEYSLKNKQSNKKTMCDSKFR